MSPPLSSEAPFAGSVAIFGVGLIGGSLAAALKQRRFTGRVIGVGRSLERLEAARKRGLLDEVSTDADAAARAADLLVFCTPVDRIVADVGRAATHCRAGTLLTDAGSVKGSICRALDGALPRGATFIGSHPLAGSEKQGFEHARPDLFEGRVCVLTPAAATPAEPLDRLRRLWRFVGARTIEMSPETHDVALAATSHAPHVVAAALAAALPEEFHPLAATGFRDTTRIAAGDPDLWLAILRNNAAPIVAALDRVQQGLAEYRAALLAEDPARLKTLLEIAKRRRDALTEAGNSARPRMS